MFIPSKKSRLASTPHVEKAIIPFPLLDLPTEVIGEILARLGKEMEHMPQISRFIYKLVHSKKDLHFFWTFQTLFNHKCPPPLSFTTPRSFKMFCHTLNAWLIRAPLSGLKNFSNFEPSIAKFLKGSRSVETWNAFSQRIYPHLDEATQVRVKKWMENCPSKLLIPLPPPSAETRKIDTTFTSLKQSLRLQNWEEAQKAAQKIVDQKPFIPTLSNFLILKAALALPLSLEAWEVHLKEFTEETFNSGNWPLWMYVEICELTSFYNLDLAFKIFQTVFSQPHHPSQSKRIFFCQFATLFLPHTLLENIPKEALPWDNWKKLLPWVDFFLSEPFNMDRNFFTVGEQLLNLLCIIKRTNYPDPILKVQLYKVLDVIAFKIFNRTEDVRFLALYGLIKFRIMAKFQKE